MHEQPFTLQTIPENPQSRSPFHSRYYFYFHFRFHFNKCSSKDKSERENKMNPSLHSVFV